MLGRARCCNNARSPPAPSLSRRPARRFWGWGAPDAALDAKQQATIQQMVGLLGGRYAELPPPTVTEFTLPAPRVAAPTAVAAMFSQTPLDRLNHSYGKSYADCARMWLRSVRRPPDWVAFTDDEQAMVDFPKGGSVSGLR